MFGEDAVFSLSNGQYKTANLIRQGDIILNKFRRPIKVSRVHIIKNVPVITLHLNNGTNPFHVNPELKVFAHFTNEEGVHFTGYKPIREVRKLNGTIKRIINLFSPSSNVEILSYMDSDIRDVYCIHTSEDDLTMIVNDIIICGHRE